MWILYAVDCGRLEYINDSMQSTKCCSWQWRLNVNATQFNAFVGSVSTNNRACIKIFENSRMERTVHDRWKVYVSTRQ